MSRSLCSKELYSAFLRVTSQRYSALSLSEVSPTNLSHDSISRWLSDQCLRPSDIWMAASAQVLGSALGVLAADDTVLSKQRSAKMELVRYQYSGTEHDVIKGIGLLNFLWISPSGDVIPMDYRIWEPRDDGKTKNDHFREMLKEARRREVKPQAVVADCWYSSLDNLKAISSLNWFWVMGLKKNRVVNRGETLDALSIPEGGLKVHLRGYGHITVFRFAATNGRTDYFGTNLPTPTLEEVTALVKKRWEIEVFHRELKQTCGLQSCQARASRSQRNHIGLSILTWIKQADLRRRSHLSFYQQQWAIIKPAITKQLKLELSPVT